MQKVRRSIIAAAAVSALTCPAVAQSRRPVVAAAPPVPAPIFCSEGTIGGKCVNPGVARAGRQAAIAFTQAQISITEHPFPASSDTTYAYPFNVAGAPSFLQRETLFGAFGTQGAFEIRTRAH